MVQRRHSTSVMVQRRHSTSVMVARRHSTSVMVQTSDVFYVSDGSKMSFYVSNGSETSFYVGNGSETSFYVGMTPVTSHTILNLQIHCIPQITPPPPAICAEIRRQCTTGTSQIDGSPPHGKYKLPTSDKYRHTCVEV